MTVLLNDIHARLNPTEVHEVVTPTTEGEVVQAVRRAADQGLAISLCGGRHAMGGQQFGAGNLQLDLSRLDGVGPVDVDRVPADGDRVPADGDHVVVRAGAGVQWPQLAAALATSPLTFRQKQTGADRLSLGGALSANVHGRGLQFPPFVSDVERFRLVDASGAVQVCSRTENAELFRRAIGGYGLFGVVTEVELRLVKRHKLRRVVEIAALDEVEASFDARLSQGFTYGDFQFMTDPTAPGFLNRGVLSAYLPVDDDAPVTASPTELSAEQWQQLLALAHDDKGRAFELYAGHYLATHGQVYLSDLHQMGVYVDGYHERMGGPDRGQGGVSASEMITEVYVPREQLTGFMRACREDFRAHQVEFIYGTIRVIEPDTETALPWAQGNRACVIFNLHVRHDPAGVAKAAADFRRIIDRALERGGSFFLTYHRWATAEQVRAAHPRFVEFLQAKRRFDPDERFASDWYRHWKALFADAVG